LVYGSNDVTAKLLVDVRRTKCREPILAVADFSNFLRGANLENSESEATKRSSAKNRRSGNNTTPSRPLQLGFDYINQLCCDLQHFLLSPYLIGR
jgi:hypothetical protein